MHLRAVSAAIAALCVTACSAGPHEFAPTIGHAVPHLSVYASDREKCRIQVGLGQRSQFASRIASDRAHAYADPREIKRATAACLAEHGYAVSGWVRVKEPRPVSFAKGSKAKRTPEAEQEEADPTSVRPDRQSSSPVRRRRRLG